MLKRAREKERKIEKEGKREAHQENGYKDGELLVAPSSDWKNQPRNMATKRFNCFSATLNALFPFLQRVVALRGRRKWQGETRRGAGTLHDA